MISELILSNQKKNSSGTNIKIDIEHTIKSVCRGDSWLSFSPLRIIFVKIPFNVDARTLIIRKHNPINVIHIY